ncbi:MAG: hypothetical protein PSV18_06515 [Methylobacter sp.]|uniref:Uncharacterized protein n=1 Tax=Candidatus Methylobacter titanis TaxID=3053457 RepID=A0AA43Q6A3_9GAMM|nr:hypothetical protein [Candidatus Methylobacter titanis]MDI1292382.1 hypothetical protein [Candidatus Methylobacter titanis]
MKSLHKPKLITRLFKELIDGGLCCGQANETDRQMLTRVGKQFVILLLIITLSDDLLD